jgi:N-acetylglutamate synthase
MAQPPLEWRVEETCLNAWPALREVLLDGWLLRFSDGLSRRANSANPLRPVASADRRACEALYRRLGLPTIFRLLSLIDPSVDEELAEAGYTREGDSCVLYGEIGDVGGARDPEIMLLPQASPEWLAAMAALQNHTTAQALTYRRIVGQIAIPAVFAALWVEGEAAALAYGAMHEELFCYESVITDSRRQRRGYARRIITSLASWARGQGAEGVCLEVEAHNLPARALYGSVGIKTELYWYHYRREPQRG